MMEKRTLAPPSVGEQSQGPWRERILALPTYLGKTRKRRPWLAVGFVAALAVGIWYASLRRPTGPAAGTALQGPAGPLTVACETFHIGSLNIHGCVGRDRRYDESRVARSLRGLDIVGLNEVHGWSFAESANQAAALGQLLGMGWLYAPAAQRWYCQQFGNGLLTTRPTEQWERIPLPGTFGKELRNLLLVRTRHQDRSVQILVTHLVHGNRTLREEQFQRVRALFLSLNEPVILAGDLNANGSDPQIRSLLAVPGVVDALGLKRPSTGKTGIDWILLRGLRVLDAGIREEGASDHPLVWAELAWPPASKATATADRKPSGMVLPERKQLE